MSYKESRAERTLRPKLSDSRLGSIVEANIHQG